MILRILWGEMESQCSFDLRCLHICIWVFLSLLLFEKSLFSLPIYCLCFSFDIYLTLVSLACVRAFKLGKRPFVSSIISWGFRDKKVMIYTYIWKYFQFVFFLQPQFVRSYSNVFLKLKLVFERLLSFNICVNIIFPAPFMESLTISSLWLFCVFIKEFMFGFFTLFPCPTCLISECHHTVFTIITL